MFVHFIDHLVIRHAEVIQHERCTSSYETTNHIGTYRISRVKNLELKLKKSMKSTNLVLRASFTLSGYAQPQIRKQIKTPRARL